VKVSAYKRKVSLSFYAQKIPGLYTGFQGYAPFVLSVVGKPCLAVDNHLSLYTLRQTQARAGKNRKP
jgi:hypothetical protein